VGWSSIGWCQRTSVSCSSRSTSASHTLKSSSASASYSGIDQPLVGRKDELARIESALAKASIGAGTTLIVSGEAGVGKTRLLTAAAESAQQKGWQVVVGRAYAVETGIPYALFADAFVPLLRNMEASRLTLLTRGGLGELAYLFPALGAPGERDRVAANTDASELKARLQWNFAQLLGKLAAKQPLLIVLENLHWADASSLELFHFVARQIPTQSIAILASYNDAEREAAASVRGIEQSLAGIGAASQMRLGPLSHEAVAEIVQRRFGVDAGTSRQFVALLYGWTRGNAFFVDETLKWLVESRALEQENGTWIGWNIESLNLPPTVRDAVTSRIDRLSERARAIANTAAVFGARLSFEQLRSISGFGETELVSVLVELALQHVFEEIPMTGEAAYDFTHPVLQQVTYAQLGAARARLLHGQIAESLENFYGSGASSHAGELAFHFARSGSLAPKAVKYLSEAGRNALSTYANREAAAFLTAAMQQTEQSGASDDDKIAIIRHLARARQRLGEYESALELWQKARQFFVARGEQASVSDIDYRIGLACFFSGRFDEALTHYDNGLRAAALITARSSSVRLYLARAICLQELGKIDAAKSEAEKALSEAQQSGMQALLSRAHRALLLLYAWTGPAATARDHGTRALEFARLSGETMLEWSAHWSLGVLAGLTGNAVEVLQHIRECQRLEDKLQSPLLPLWTAELSIQYSSWLGLWDEGISTGERTISLARSLNQRALLPRLLVWTGLIYLWRHDLARAKEYFDEAWTLSGAGEATEQRIDVQTVVPAHMGLAAYHLETDNLAEAIRIGEAGLTLADKLGYVAWALQWLIPVVGEAALWSRDFERCERHCARMRSDGEKLSNSIAVAMADTGDGMLRLLRDSDPAAAIPLLRLAIERLEQIPLPDPASRIRRALAQALTEAGDRESALKELRVAHDIFARIGSAGELENVRDEIRKLGSRPPPRTSSEGMGGLTGRELEIARLVASRKSNREIGDALDISARTVSTHLSNIFAKVGVSSRGELADFIRESSLQQGV
jgi:DNA-binding CsgD family transcriptional regulator